MRIITIVAMCSMLFGASVTSVSAAMDTLWTRRWAGPASMNDAPTSMCVDSMGNSLVTGHTWGQSSATDILTLKYSPSGELLWGRTYFGDSGSWDQGNDIAVDQSGNVYVAGATTTTLPNYQMTTLKYSPDGDLLWARHFIGAGRVSDAGLSLAVDSVGFVYVAGFSAVSYDTAGVFRWSQSFDYNPKSCALDGAGKFYVLGYAYLGSYYKNDIFITSYTTSGAKEWTVQYNGLFDPVSDYTHDSPAKMVVPFPGAIYIIGGSYLGTRHDCLFLRYNSAGVKTWESRIPNSEGLDISWDKEGHLLVTGMTDFGGGGTGCITVAYDLTGSVLWNRRFDSPMAGDDRGVSITQKDDSVIAVLVSEPGTVTGTALAILEYSANGTYLGRIAYTSPSSVNPLALRADGSGGAVATASSGNSNNHTLDILTLKYSDCTDFQSPPIPVSSDPFPCPDEPYEIAWPVGQSIGRYVLHENGVDIFDGPDTSVTVSHEFGEYSYTLSTGTDACGVGTPSLESAATSIQPTPDPPSSVWIDPWLGCIGDSLEIHWASVEAAVEYQLQIDSGPWLSVTDTILTTTLDPGSYAIRVRSVGTCGPGTPMDATNEAFITDCPCHADPVCDSVTDILDVTLSIDVAFRNAPAITDTLTVCQSDITDVNCTGATDIFDVVAFIEVAFRAADPLTRFCDPCL